jgi:hypothetical protein
VRTLPRLQSANSFLLNKMQFGFPVALPVCGGQQT